MCGPARRGHCGFFKKERLQQDFSVDMTSRDLLANVLIPLYESPTYTANLCPLCRRAEFASLSEDFGEPIRKAVEAASRRAIW
jgi:hypothetical protein